jgi:integrase
LATHNPRKSLKLALSHPLRGLEWWPRGGLEINGSTAPVDGIQHGSPSAQDHTRVILPPLAWAELARATGGFCPTEGSHRLRRPLPPPPYGSLAIAERTKHRAIAALKDRLQAAEGELKRRTGGDPLLLEGLDWRQSFKDEEQRASDDEGYVSTALEARWEEVAKAQGEERANTLASIATGRAMPIGPLADQWLAEKPLKGKQRLDYRRAVTKLETWMADKALPPTLQAVSKQIAASYRDEAFVRAGTHSRSANKDLSALSGLWKHAERKDFITGNPWRGQFLPQSTASSSHKRPLSTDEVRRLLTALDSPKTPMQGLLRDTVAVLACSGLRVEEWATMKVTDLRDLTGPIPYVALKGTKTAAARRDVPIHPAILPIIHRRTATAGLDGYLVGELNTPPEGAAWGPGQPITKEFGRLRKRLGIDEREPGARQARAGLENLDRSISGFSA